MFTNFKRYLNEKATFTEEDFKKIESVCVFKHLETGEKLLEEGKTWHHNAFVDKGLVRGYIIDTRGNERSINFSPEDYWCGDRESLLTGNPSKVNIEALAPTDLIMIHKPDFDLLCVDMPPFSEFMANLIQKNLEAFQQRAEETRNYTDEQKVAAFQKKFPTVTGRAPLITIATYLDIPVEKIEAILNNS